jgi:hypothetical protein
MHTKVFKKTLDKKAAKISRKMQRGRMMKPSMRKSLLLLSSFFLSLITSDAQTTEVGDIFAACQDEFTALTMDNTDVSGAQSMFIEDMLNACTNENKTECSYDVGLFTGASVTMNGCEMMQLDNLQEKCEAAGATFCTLSGTVNATVVVSGAEIPINVPAKIKADCIGLCLPTNCSPWILEDFSPFEFGLDFITKELGDEIGSELDIDLAIEVSTLSASFDCMETDDETGIPVEEKGAGRALRA